MSVSLQADSTLPQGHILVDGQRVASVSTTGGLSATLAANTVTTSSLVSGAITTEKIASNSVTTEKLSAQAVTFDKISQNSGPFSFRNKIINGDMRINQRAHFRPTASVQKVGGTSGSLPFFIVDRFVFDVNQNGVTGGTVTCGWSTDVPNTTFQNSISAKVDVATDTDTGGNKVTNIQHRIEGYNITDLIDNTFTLSFWAKSNLPGTYSVSFRNADLNRAYISQYNINTANTWEYKTITVQGGLPSSGTWNTTNGVGVYLDFTLDSNPLNETTSLNTWIINQNRIASFNQVKWMSTLNNNFYITGIQLERGSIATPFEVRPYGTELALCQRYYYQLNGRTDPAGGGITSIATGGFANSATAIWLHINFPVQMRIGPPTLTYSDISHFDIEPWDTVPTGIGIDTAVRPNGTTDAMLILTTAGRTTGNTGGLVFQGNFPTSYMAFYAE